MALGGRGKYRCYLKTFPHFKPQRIPTSPGLVFQLVGMSSSTLKVYRFHSQSGHIPRLWVQSPVRVLVGGNQSMFLSHINASLSLSLSLSLPSINIAFVRIKKEQERKESLQVGNK